jgi:excisionase family DNA binding protein
MPKLDEYLQITEAAEFLGVCRNTLRNWVRSGQIKEHRHPINNYRLYLKGSSKAVIFKRKQIVASDGR